MAVTPQQQRLPAVALAAVLLLGLVSGLAWALDFPPLSGRVVDDANVISPVVRTSIEQKSKELEEKSGIQLVVATVKSLQGSDIETFANQLFRAWKLGEAKKNNGVLLLVAPTEHKVRIEVGYGLEGTLTDALSQVIIAGSMVPRFKADDYSGGIMRGVDGIISVLSTDASEWQTKPKVRSEDEESPFDILLPMLLFLVVIFIFRNMLGNARGPSGTLRRTARTNRLHSLRRAKLGRWFWLGRRVVLGRLLGRRRIFGGRRVIRWRRRLGKLVMLLTEDDRKAILAAIRGRGAAHLRADCLRAGALILRLLGSAGAMGGGFGADLFPGP